MNIIRIAILVFVLLAGFTAPPSRAAQPVVQTEGAYIMQGADTNEKAELWALQEAKLRALDNMTPYLEFILKNNEDITLAELKGLAAGYISPTEGSISRSITEEAPAKSGIIKKFTIKLSYRLAVEDLHREAARLKTVRQGRDYLRQLAAIISRYNQLIADNKKLKADMQLLKEPPQLQRLAKDDTEQHLLLLKLQAWEKGVNLALRDNYNAALETYTKANVTWPEIYLNKGKAYFQLKNYQQALIEFSRAIELNAGYAAAYCGRGHVYRELQDFKMALENYDKTVELDNSDAEAYFGRAAILEATGNSQDAIAEYAKAIQLKVENPYHGLANYNLGNIFFNAKNAQRRAMVHYLAVINNPVIGNDPQYIKTYINLSIIYQGMKQYAAIPPVLDKALQIDPANAEAYFLRAAAYEALGKPEQAKADYMRAAELNPAYSAKVKETQQPEQSKTAS